MSTSTSLFLERRLFLFSGPGLIAGTLIGSLALLALLIGQQDVSADAAARVGFAQKYEQELKEWRDSLAAIESGATDAQPRDARPMNLSFPAVLPPAPLADFASGREQLYPSTTVISGWSNPATLFTEYEFDNPTQHRQPRPDLPGCCTDASDHDRRVLRHSFNRPRTTPCPPDSCAVRHPQPPDLGTSCAAQSGHVGCSYRRDGNCRTVSTQRRFRKHTDHALSGVACNRSAVRPVLVWSDRVLQRIPEAQRDRRINTLRSLGGFFSLPYPLSVARWLRDCIHHPRGWRSCQRCARERLRRFVRPLSSRPASSLITRR